jgi:sulfur relay (sulfurtransferase) complex TusBCD TusD component (DsrE family)
LVADRQDVDALAFEDLFTSASDSVGFYGTERSCNGLRLAGSLAKRDGEQVRVFLIGDAASCAKAGQKVPQGYYNTERMLGSVTRRGVKSGCAAPAWTHGA